MRAITDIATDIHNTNALILLLFLVHQVSKCLLFCANSFPVVEYVSFKQLVSESRPVLQLCHPSTVPTGNGDYSSARGITTQVKQCCIGGSLGLLQLRMLYIEALAFIA
jgi:hypothetical protein